MSFNTDALLNKRSPLAAVWMASHVERKVAKTVLLRVNIPDSVDAITGGTEGDSHVEILALRLSGQLLLGVARIYSRKAKYLMDDCSEALLRLRSAFKSAGSSTAQGARARGDVDMPENEDAGRGNININLALDAGRNADFDMLFNADFGGMGGMWDDLDALRTPRAIRQKAPGTSRTTVSRNADITLAEDDIDLPPHEGDDRGSPFPDDEMGIASQEYRAMSASINGGDELDLGLDLELDFGLGNELDLGLDNENDIDLGSSSPAPGASKQQGQSTSRVAAIAAEARARSSSEAPSVELGRDAAPPRALRDSIDRELLPEAAADMDQSVLKNNTTFDSDNGQPAFQGNDMDDFAGNNFGDLDMGQRTPRALSPAGSQAPGDRERTPQTAADAEQGAAPTDESQPIDMTPKTAKQVADAAALESATRKRKENANPTTRQKPAKVRKQIIDSVIELEQQRRVVGDSQSQGQSQTTLGGVSLATKEERMQQGLLKETRYLPKSAIQLRFQEVAANPTPHFLGGLLGAFTESGNKGDGFYAGPPGLPQELQTLFRFTLSKKGSLNGAPKRIRAEEQQEQQRKRARSQSEAPSVELGRERQPSMAGDMDGLLDFGGAPGDDSEFMGNDFDMGGLDRDVNLDLGNASHRTIEKTPSRMGTPLPGALDISFNIDFDAIDRANQSVLAVFDSATKASQPQNMVTPAKSTRGGMLSVPGTRSSAINSQQGEQESQADETVLETRHAGKRGTKWSENTVKAIKLLEHEFGSKEEEKVLSFNKLADKASRKAAASMFFETLILGTRNCLKMEQSEPYGDIKISSQPELWEVCDSLNKLSVENQAASREATPAASVRSRRSVSINI